MKRILVPIDFSDHSTNALQYAIHFIQEMEAEVLLLHVIEVEMAIMDLPVPSAYATDKKKEAAELATKAILDHTHMYAQQQHLEQPRMESIYRFGTTIENIIETAEKEEVDLIIMGARGDKKSNLEKFFGTKSSEVAKRSGRPVLLVPGDYQFAPIVQLVYATDLTASDPYELWRALNIIAPFSPIVRCVHISDKPDEREQARIESFRQYLEERNPALQVIFYQLYNEDIDQALETFAEDIDAELLVIFHQNKNLWSHWFGRTHTGHLSSMIRKPLLVLCRS